MAFNSNIIPNDLIKNFKENHGVFFIGAGLSMGAGYPGWEGLLKGLISAANKQRWISKEKIADYKKMINDSSKFLFIAEDLKNELGQSFYDYMEKVFSEEKKSPTTTHKTLVNIKTSLLLTINYDELLEKAYNEVHGEYPNSFVYSQSREAANNFWQDKFFILKAHGDAKRDVKSLILSQKDYRKVLYRETGYRSLLQAIFTIKSIVFLGVSFNDPEFNQLLDYLHDSYHGGGPIHYLIIDEDSVNNTLAKRYKEDFNIFTLAFDNSKKDYSFNNSFLKFLNKELNKK